jgi:hypothetical protein
MATIGSYLQDILQKFRLVENISKHSDQLASQQLQRAKDHLINNVELPSVNGYSQPNTLENSQLHREGLSSNRIDSRREYLYNYEKVSLYKEVDSNVEILVKEYKLENFGFNNQAQITERQKEFKKIVESNLQIANGPDFRIVKFFRVENQENKSYLISKYISNSITLKQYLADNGVMTAKQIREVIKQALESLQYLHSYCKGNFPPDKMSRGLPHGNINLESLLIKYNPTSVISEKRQFLIYLTDLALWEHLFLPQKPIANSRENLGSEKEDFQDLANVAFVLAGGSVDSGSLSLLNFTSETPWSNLKDNELKEFIQQLAGFGFIFNNAEEALNALNKLPEPSIQLTNNEETQKKITHVPQNSQKILYPVLFISLLGLLIALLVLILNLAKNREAIPESQNNTPEPTPNNTSTVKNVLIQDVTKNIISFNYIVEPGSGWDTALSQRIENPTLDKANSQTNQKPSKANSQTSQKPSKAKNGIINEFKIRKITLNQLPINLSKKKAVGNTITNTIHEKILEELSSNSNEQNKPDFALMRLSNNLKDELNKRSLKYEILAYDALVIVVPFSDISQGSAAKALDGKLTISDLGNLYTTEREGATTKAYFPDDENTIELFKDLVFKKDDNKKKQFQSLLVQSDRESEQAQVKSAIGNKEKKNIKPKSRKMYEKIFNTINSSTIGIGFDRLSNVFGQCSVYPLAIGENNQTIQVIKQSNGEIQSEDSNLDLCSDKGSYWVDLEVENGKPKYPLALPLVIVYKEGSLKGEKFAEIIETDEGQYLLNQVGLVTQKPINELRKTLWNLKS